MKNLKSSFVFLIKLLLVYYFSFIKKINVKIRNKYGKSEKIKEKIGKSFKYGIVLFKNPKIKSTS